MTSRENIAPQQTGNGFYSAAQLAVALKIAKRNALKALAGVEPSGTLIVQGNRFNRAGRITAG
jgi:hypothetical protein